MKIVHICSKLEFNSGQTAQNISITARWKYNEVITKKNQIKKNVYMFFRLLYQCEVIIYLEH